jgi:HPt (histidine-containing phosphotransfer) domain-containing protein
MAGNAIHSRSTLNFDLDGALERLGGDEGFLAEVGQLFVECSPAMVNDIRAALARSDAVAAQRAAHTLKGSVSNFGALALVECLQKLEAAALAQDFKTAGELQRAAETGVHDLTQILLSWIAGEEIAG